MHDLMPIHCYEHHGYCNELSNAAIYRFSAVTTPSSLFWDQLQTQLAWKKHNLATITFIDSKLKHVTVPPATIYKCKLPTNCSKEIEIPKSKTPCVLNECMTFQMNFGCLATVRYWQQKTLCWPKHYQSRPLSRPWNWCLVDYDQVISSTEPF